VCRIALCRARGTRVRDSRPPSVETAGLSWLKPYRLVLKGNCTEVGVRSSTRTTNFFAGDDVTNPHRMPDDRQAVIDVQNAIKKRRC